MTPPKKVTIDDVAVHAGVSKGTVSAVINDKPTVNSQTRERVLKSIQELNYRPKGVARNLKKEKAQSIGLVVKEINNPYISALILGVKEYACEKNYSLYVASSEGDHIEECHMIGMFSAKDFSGIIISPVLGNPAEINHLFSLKKMNCPFVLLEELEGIHANVVSINNLKATKEVTRYLFELGHSKILYFAGPRYTSHTKEKLAGFREAFSESPYIFNQEKMVVWCGSQLNQGYQTGLKYFENRSRDEFPTGIVCFNDLSALGLMSALNELGIQVPDEISVVGHDNIELAARWPIPLTTVHVPIREIGKKAAELLIRNIESEESLPAELTEMDSELIVRDSTRTLS